MSTVTDRVSWSVTEEEEMVTAERRAAVVSPTTIKA